MWSRRAVFATTLWMLAMIALGGIFIGIGVESGTPLAWVVAGTALIFIVIATLMWVLFGMEAYRKP